jgi:hypothetical protein
MWETLLHDSFYSDKQKKELDAKYEFYENYRAPAVASQPRASQSLTADRVRQKKEKLDSIWGEQ